MVEDLYKMQSVDSRWASFENPTGAKGGAARENKGAKGHAFDWLKPGGTFTLMDFKGSGCIRRMWMTINRWTPEHLRSFRLRMFWDGSERPAVDVPLGDFMGAIMGRMGTLENALFSTGQGRSFNCYVPMPFRKSARVTLTNEHPADALQIFYDINFTAGDDWTRDTLYFHSHFRRERFSKLGEDFALLPLVKGRGRYVGAHIGVLEHPEIEGWFGEGECKIYVDGDREWPSMAGTGTEDFIGTAWGQQPFQNAYHGCLIQDAELKQNTFYRYHIPDPVFFHEDVRVTLQQLGGTFKGFIEKMQAEGKEIDPVSIADGEGFIKLYEEADPKATLAAAGEKVWVNYYRRDDVCATSFFYLDRPDNDLPELPSREARIEALPVPKPPKKEG